MHITYRFNKGRFAAVDWPYADREIPKTAGFRWDAAAREWWTFNLAIALRLEAHFDDAAKQKVQRPISLTVYQDAYVARVPYSDIYNAKLKALAFHWNAEYKWWETRDAAAAQALAGLACVVVSVAATAKLKALAEEAQLSAATEAAIAVPAPAGRAYLPYQLAGIDYARRRPATLVADEMGLGKTIEAIGFINFDASIESVLIVSPLTVKLNWERELQAWLTRPLTIGMATSKRWPNTNIVIVHPDILVKCAEHVHAKEWDLAIIDEAHLFKSYKAQRSQVIFGGQDKPKLQARRKLALTGTPIPNRPIEIFGVLQWLDPNCWHSLRDFAKRYCGEARSRYSSLGWDTKGASNLDELQEQLRRTVMLRRLKQDVLTELPDKLRQVIVIDQDDLDAPTKSIFAREAQRMREMQDAARIMRKQAEALRAVGGVAYQKAVEALRDAQAVSLGEISALRHETALAKVPLVVAEAKRMLDSSAEAKLVLWAHHRDVVEAIMAELTEYSPVSIIGGDAADKRQQAIDDFQTRNARVFVGSIQAAGVGITLTAASIAIFAELDWVPGNITQCEDRCHRIGQKDMVHCLHLVVDGSIDAMLAKTLVEKQKVIAQALDGPAADADMMHMVDLLLGAKDDSAKDDKVLVAVGG